MGTQGCHKIKGVAVINWSFVVVDVIKEEAQCLVFFPAVIQSSVFLHVESFRYVRDSVELSSFSLYGVIVMPQKQHPCQVFL